MSQFTSRTLAIAATAVLSSALALASTPMDQILEHAKNVQRDAEQLHAALKVKNVDAADLKTKLSATTGDIDKLKQLVADYEAAHSGMTARDQADWELIKSKVQLLSIFHDRKKELLNGDINKNRSMLRAHASGVAKRVAL